MPGFIGLGLAYCDHYQRSHIVSILMPNSFVVRLHWFWLEKLTDSCLVR